MNNFFFASPSNRKIMLLFFTAIFVPASFAYSFLNKTIYVSFSIDNAKTVYFSPHSKNMLIPISNIYKLAALRLKGKTIIEYPVLLNPTNSKIINSINKTIKDTAYSYLENMDTFDNEPPHDKATSIIAASAGIFGVDIPVGEGEPSTGYGLQTYSDRHIWDLESGEDLIQIYDHKTYSIKKDKNEVFWQTVVENNPDEINTEICKDYDEANKESFALFTDGYTLKASNLATSGGDYHAHCGHAYDVPYDKVKDYIIFDKTFIKFLPKFISAGLIDPKFGNKILSNEK